MMKKIRRTIGFPLIPALLFLLLILCPELYGGAAPAFSHAVQTFGTAAEDAPGTSCTLSVNRDAIRFASFFFAALSHECGHLLMMGLLGVPVRGFRLSPAGAVLTADFAGSGCSYRAEALVHASGAAVNLFSALLLSLLCCPDAAAAPLLLGIYNLLPVSCFDGGRLLRALLLSCFPDADAAERLADGISYFTAGVLYLFSGWLLWSGALHDPSGGVLRYGTLFFAVFSSILFLHGKGSGHNCP